MFTKGGIGVLMILEKWKWNIFHNQGELWARILNSKYGNCGNLEGVCRGNRVSAWSKDINNILIAGEEGRCLANGIQWKVGCGAKVKFWEDGWKEDGVSLKQKYPTLFSISKQQNQVIQQMGSFFDEGWE